ncbi:MAG: hypothetical protein HY721_17920, partial [Planctomycetes bacterium]|nr:hypothetical protein [Planctomycetota bacterium]
DAADADDDGRLTLSDAVATLGTLFLGQPPLPPPGPGGSGPDPTPDELGDCGLPGCQAPFLPRRCAELPEELTVGTDPCQP